MKRKLLTIAVGLMLVGCASSHWKPDSLHTGGYTYDSGHQTYVDVGLSGELGTNGIRMDVYGLMVHDNGETFPGVGVNFEFPLNK